MYNKRKQNLLPFIMYVGHDINLVGNETNHGYLSPSVANHKSLAAMGERSETAKSLSLRTETG